MSLWIIRINMRAHSHLADAIGHFRPGVRPGDGQLLRQNGSPNAGAGLLDNAGSNLVATIPAFTNGNSSPLALLPAPPLVLSKPPNTTNGAGGTAVLRAGVGVPAIDVSMV